MLDWHYYIRNDLASKKVKNQHFTGVLQTCSENNGIKARPKKKKEKKKKKHVEGVDLSFSSSAKVPLKGSLQCLAE